MTTDFSSKLNLTQIFSTCNPVILVYERDRFYIAYPKKKKWTISESIFIRKILQSRFLQEAHSPISGESQQFDIWGVLIDSENKETLVEGPYILFLKPKEIKSKEGYYRFELRAVDYPGDYVSDCFELVIQ